MLGYLPYSSGDHYMQAMSYLAVAHGTKLYDKDGRLDGNLWKAYKKAENTDENGIHSKGYSLEFSRNCFLSASQITTDSLNKEGVFLKEVPKTTANFENWLVWQIDENFADETYKRNHAREYMDYRKQFNSLSTNDLMKYSADKYDVLTSILQKTEGYLDSTSPLAAVPSFSAKEQAYMTTKNVGTGNYADILQAVRDDIYGMVWTKADESAYMDKCREVNNRLHGIYNEQDKTAWHQQWYTNAFLAMKGWALGFLEMLYSPNHYSISLGKNVEGFVNTAVKIPMSTLIGTFTGANHMGFVDMLISMISPWSKRSRKAMQQAGFSEEQNFNARRMVASELLIMLLFALRLATAPPDKDEEDDEKEADVATGLIYYLAMRTLFEQEALLPSDQLFIEGGQLMDFIPVGFAALNDLGGLFKEGVGALAGDETDSDYFYQRDDPNGRYEQYDSKFRRHLERLIPYYKNVWAVQNPYQAADNYEFGRKLRTR